VCVEENSEGGFFTVSQDEEAYCVDRSAGLTASWLLHLIGQQFVCRAKGGLLVHAAAVCLGSNGLLLPGASGSGKSTLTAVLTARGFGYLTDELAYLPWRALALEGFTVPLKIKKAGLDSLEGRLSTRAGALMRVPDGLLVDPDGPVGARTTVTVSAIVFPRHEPGGSFRLTALSPAQAGLRLMATVLNRASLPEHGFREVARLVGLTTGYELRYGDIGQIESHLDAIHLMTATRRDDSAPTTGRSST
jgi:hypothetical protein